MWPLIAKNVILIKEHGIWILVKWASSQSDVISEIRLRDIAL